MKLTVHERFAILNMLPDEDKFAGMKAILKAKGVLNFSPEDVALYKMKSDVNGNWTWDLDLAQKHVLDAPLEEYVVSIIRQQLEKMDKVGKIKKQHMSLYEKIILAYRSTEE